MQEVRCYMPKELIDGINKRCDKLAMSKSEYLRLLAKFDILIQRYHELSKYTDALYNNICDCCNSLELEDKVLF